MESKHISTWVDRPADEVYAFAADPRNLPSWAAGLGGSIEQVDGRWIADSPMGRVQVEFAPPNEYGVLDHDVTLPTGQTVHNPLRVLPAGEGAEVVFTLRRLDGVDDEAYAKDAAAIARDLAALKGLLEKPAG